MSFSAVEARVAELITKGLREGLVHPGNPDTDQPSVAIPIPAFRTASMPPEMSEHVTTTARLIGEAIVHQIKSEATLVPNDEYAKLTGTEHPPVPDGRVVVYCRRCQNPVTRLVTRNNVATTDPKLLVHELSGHEC